MALFVVKKRLERHWISDARRSKSALPREQKKNMRGQPIMEHIIDVLKADFEFDKGKRQSYSNV